MMQSDAGRGPSPGGPGSIETAAQARPSPISERAHELPPKMARGVSALLRPRSTPGRHGITVPAMSADWLLQSAVKSGKCGDPV
jgi:hypothetical protein